MGVLNRALDEPMKAEERSAMPLAGGIVGHGYQCGMVWGAALAAGAQAYRLHGPGSKAETRAIFLTQRLVESFRALKNTIDCHDITGLNRSATARQMIEFALLKGGVVGCFSLAAKYAQAAFSEISNAISEESIEAHFAPISCTAILAQRIGASDMHTVMAAGLAGGIGLSGGACGALGTAIWINGMNNLKNGGKIQYKDPKASDAIDRFLKCTNGEFECAKIVGRKFESVTDHASYLAGGGCSEIIEVLAATLQRSSAFNSLAPAQ